MWVIPGAFRTPEDTLGQQAVHTRTGQPSPALLPSQLQTQWSLNLPCTLKTCVGDTPSFPHPRGCHGSTGGAHMCTVTLVASFPHSCQTSTPPSSPPARRAWGTLHPFHALSDTMAMGQQVAQTRALLRWLTASHAPAIPAQNPAVRCPPHAHKMRVGNTPSFPHPRRRYEPTDSANT